MGGSVLQKEVLSLWLAQSLTFDARLGCESGFRTSLVSQPPLFFATDLGLNLPCEVWVWVVPTTAVAAPCDRPKLKGNQPPLQLRVGGIPGNCGFKPIKMMIWQRAAENVWELIGLFQATVLLPVNVWQILELRFTFEEGACSRLTDFDRMFDRVRSSQADNMQFRIQVRRAQGFLG